ncbi:unnamed protein product [Gongylonema pulchrum]|uniref:Transport and Golgi organization protein 2 homolog n=1 Tax=Gongylonema pulchrum TaxID=637853 RepID=A0A183ESV5_9BILA|nr:unnamed protein product [Gongylonema pulchrum]
MCVTFVYIDHNPDVKYKLILLNNRDEFLSRPTSNAQWEDGVLAGRDEKDSNSRGTWLCIDKSGRISNLLTITVPMHQMKREATSRGQILSITFEAFLSLGNSTPVLSLLCNADAVNPKKLSTNKSKDLEN